MADKITVSSHHSYGSRVGNSFKAILWWIFLVIVSIVLLFWNEKNYVETKAALDEWAKVVQEADANQINSELEWSEVHVSGETASDAEALTDDIFWVTTNNLKLKRTVEMYQWYEESREECHDNYWWSEDCETTYTYDTKWDDKAIDSSNFEYINNHENPSTWEYESDERVKEPITLWAYTLTTVFVDKLTDYKTVNLSEQNINIPEKYKLIADQNTTAQTSETTTVEDNNNSYLYGDSDNSNGENGTTSTTTATNERFHINGNQIYIWADPTKPAVWDLKITFSSVKPWTVSIVWKQMGNELTSYKVSNWRNINLLSQGNVSAEDMFIEAQKENKMMTWILRFFWLMLMYCGFAMMFKFIETIAKVLPFLANIIWVWTGIIALWLTLIVWFVTIGISWLVVRPIIWICCLVVAASGIFLLIKSKKDKKADLPKEEKIEEKPEIIE
jgi:hypothetical protein